VRVLSDTRTVKYADLLMAGMTWKISLSMLPV